jgi:hypothetical protein
MALATNCAGTLIEKTSDKLEDWLKKAKEEATAKICPKQESSTPTSPTKVFRFLLRIKTCMKFYLNLVKDQR